MNFEEYAKQARCVNCGQMFLKERELAIPGEDMIVLKCDCVYSFKIPLDRFIPDGDCLIHSCILGQHPTNRTVMIPVIEFDINTEQKTFKITYRSDEMPTKGDDKSKYFECDYVPDFMLLPSEQLSERVRDLIVFI